MKKERYIYLSDTNQLYDKENDNLYAYNVNKDMIISLLNQQDARIKELEEQLSTVTMYHGCDVLINELEQENQRLKEKLEVQKNKSELIAENEAMKDTIAVVLAQKSNALKSNEELRKEMEQHKEKLKVVDDFMHNYGYSNYDYGEILEDLQTRAFQAEDDTKIVEELLDYLNLSDENTILPTIKQSQNEEMAIRADERKKVVEDIKEFSKNYFTYLICNECDNPIDKDVYISSVELSEILNQVEKGEKHE